MAYLSIETILAAYRMLSTLSSDPLTQGATQKVSALRYSIALDMFYKRFGRECDVKNKDDAAAYIENVGKVVFVNEGSYTSNFYYPLSHSSDYAVGSNFFSVNVVRESITNSGQRLSFPRRGSKPIMYVQSGKLYEDENLIKNLQAYISDSLHKTALIIWLLRTVQIPESNVYGFIRSELDSMFTAGYIDQILPTQQDFDTCSETLGIKFSQNVAEVELDDIRRLFDTSSTGIITATTIQKIYFGTPGCGKSHTVSEYINNNPGIEIRTTFHPDTDYSSFVGAYKPKKKKENLTYEFVPQAFTKAYCKAWKNPDIPVYLIIEEINRGNCAQIFGDLFQLLDRSDGYSEYPIDADTDLAEYLGNELFRLDEGEVSGNEGIENGKLCLPKNLHILATMNTSDQSLFPMDSAFKRRWEWEYVPVDPANPKSQFVITIGDKRYKWASFLVKVNERIHKLSDSEDKQMGNFFIKSDIGVEEFKSKVMFYLWSEVCKEYEKCGSFFKDKGDNEAEFTFNSLYPTNEASNKRLQGFMEYLGVEEA